MVSPPALTPCPRCAKPPSQLTRQQRRIVELLAEGLQMDEIGKQLFITRDTVKTHISKLRDAIGDERVRTHAGLVAYCLRAGWLS